MADLNTRMVEAVSRLIELTQDDRITWVVSEAPRRLNEDDSVFVESVFSTEAAGRKLRLYERETRIHINPIVGAVTMAENPYWVKHVILEILDASERVIWTFPDVTPLNDLLETVRYQVADVGDFIQALADAY